MLEPQAISAEAAGNEHLYGWTPMQTPVADTSPIADMARFLAATQQEQHAELLSGVNLVSLIKELGSRTSLLVRLKALGLKHAEAQRFSNGLAKAHRLGRFERILPRPTPEPEPEPETAPTVLTPTAPRRSSAAEDPLKSLGDRLVAAWRKDDVQHLDLAAPAPTPAPRPAPRPALLQRAELPQCTQVELRRTYRRFVERHAWRQLPAVSRVWATSDLHAEHRQNMEFLERLEPRPDDALIVAGDVCSSLELLTTVFRLLLTKFAHVCYCVGNHVGATGFEPAMIPRLRFIRQLSDRTLDRSSGHPASRGSSCRGARSTS